MLSAVCVMPSHCCSVVASTEHEVSRCVGCSTRQSDVHPLTVGVLGVQAVAAAAAPGQGKLWGGCWDPHDENRIATVGGCDVQVRTPHQVHQTKHHHAKLPDKMPRNGLRSLPFKAACIPVLVHPQPAAPG